MTEPVEARTPPVDFRTDPDHPRAELRGRTLAIPFDTVWEASLRIVDEIPRWECTAADDGAGVIELHAEGWPFRSPGELRIRVTLDENGQTRVDASSVSSDGRRRVGTARRRVIRFFRHLDEAVDPEGRFVLDARTATTEEVG